MKTLRNVLGDAGLHLVLLVVLVFGLASWFSKEKPLRPLTTEDLLFSCRFCGEHWSVTSISTHIKDAHHDKVAAEWTSLTKPRTGEPSDASRVGVIQ